HHCGFIGCGLAQTGIPGHFLSFGSVDDAANPPICAHHGAAALFVSFFPQPKPFFISAAVWSLVLVFVWFMGGEQMGAMFGMPPAAEGAPPIIGVAIFWSLPFLW